jgi:hypothetical protein
MNVMGGFRLDWLSAESLDLQHAGTGTVRISGQVSEQKIILSGVGSYLAPDLASQRARVHIRGTGIARIQVHQALEATLHGVGVLEYSGNPTVSKRISGVSQIRHIVGAR